MNVQENMPETSAKEFIEQAAISLMNEKVKKDVSVALEFLPTSSTDCGPSEEDNLISKPKQLTEKILESSDTPPNSKPAITESEIKKLKKYEAFPQFFLNLKKAIPLTMKDLPSSYSENKTDEAEEKAKEKNALLSKEVDRKFQKLFEAVSLAVEVLTDPTDSKDCGAKRAAERSRLSQDMDRIFKNLNKKKSEETKGDPLALEEPPTGSKK